MTGSIMTPQQKTLVQTTWKQVEPISDTASELFYTRLFEIDPSLRSLFPKEMSEQRKKLMQMLAVAVKGLDSLDQTVPATQALGRRHVKYGVEDAHYDTVGSALLWTFEKGLGDAFTQEVKEAWTTIYTLLAGAMKEAAAQVEPAR
jgi:hemoglobin-like flavoprotein